MREEDDEFDEGDWLLDDFRKVCLSPDYEVLIDDDIYVYYSENQIFRFHSSDIDQLMKLRTLEKGEDETVPFDKLNPETKLISHDRNWGRTSNTRGGGSSQYANCNYGVDSLFQSYACNSYKKKLTFVHMVSYDITSINASFQNVPVLDSHFAVDFGDGSDVEYYDGWKFVIDHVFPEFDIYTITLTVGYDNLCEDGQQSDSDQYTYHIEVKPENCFGGNLSAVEHIEDVGKRLTAEIWVKHDIFGEHQGASSKSYAWRANAWGTNYTWRRADAKVTATINWHFRTTNGCDDYILLTSSSPSGSETDQCNSCKSKCAVKTAFTQENLKILDDEATSYHQVWYPGVNLERTLKLSFCND